MTGWVRDVLDFWFGLKPEQWWSPDLELDKQVRERFHELWEQKRSLPPDKLLSSADEALAAVILFDQFPRNMFRGNADQFATDPLALAIAKGAVDRGLDERLSKEQRGMLYMPFQHSERIEDQRRSLLLYTALGDQEMMPFVQKHHDVIARFGRFPHRNAILGRQPRPAEIEAGDVVPW